QAAPVFDAAEQSWIFRLPLHNRLLGFLLLLYTFLFTAAGLWRTWANRKTVFLNTILFVSLFLLLVLPPVIANGLSRAGLISRSTFLSIYIFFMIPGAFGLLVLYINTTRDRTRFLGRLIAICLGSFLLLFYWTALLTVGPAEQSFDERRTLEARISVSMDPPIEGVQYILRILPDGHELDYIREGSSLVLTDDSDSLITFESQMAENDVQRLLRMDSRRKPEAIGYRIQVAGQQYEVGFSYESYRNYFHDLMLKYLVIVTAALVVILLGFRYFFRGTIWNPLKSLLRAIKEVNDGDLSIQIPVRINDEIGFLADSFNQMVFSIRDAREQLAHHAESLEEQVETRTAELQSILKQQEGDYYLTSLLLRPFGARNLKLNAVEIDFLTRQKKEFQFKENRHEIGGDLSMADRVHLGGRNYTAFLNADAMGKSMQGAGGAIVMGSVFGSILNRGRIDSAGGHGASPEKWLHSAYTELTRVFEMFEGSMLVTAILGLVDESTGLVYLVNADHPSPAVLRNGKASLLRLKNIQGRIGMPRSAQHKFVVHTFQLRPGDILFIGSDGKDDLDLGGTDGMRNMNEDDDLFLRQIEKTHGDLDSIFQELSKSGDITDDLSLVRIQYRPATVNGQISEFHRSTASI
ncbi:MAG: SpoIIE family protein phosphatase, partial [Leptospiraceae bacterium]|nr:SpoIIE family protein phosphatase [Leptospiraceae bacterium]